MGLPNTIDRFTSSDQELSPRAHRRRLIARRAMSADHGAAVPPLPIQTGSPARRPPKVAKQVQSWLLKGADSVAELMVRRIRKAGFRATRAVVSGHPGQEIVRRARSDRANLVVVGSRGLTGTSRFLLGSVSDGIIKYAPCAVLVVRR